MAKFLVTTPQVGFTGVSCGVYFADGRAEVDENSHAAALRYFRGASYDVTEIDAATPVADEPERPGQGEPAQPENPEQPTPDEPTPATPEPEPAPEPKKTSRSRRAATPEGDNQ